jgi:AraC family transcriptional activator of pobA
MSVNAIKKYTYQAPFADTTGTFFEVEEISLEKSCIANQSHQSEYYKIFFLEEGKGSYSVDFNNFKLEGAGLFFLSPGQVLGVQSEAVKSGYQIMFNREFYCVETHGKEIACNGVLFNNVHQTTFIQLESGEESTFKHWVQFLIKELSNPGKAHRDLLETYLKMILIEALRVHDEQQAVTTSPASESNSQLVADFIALVDKHFRSVHAVGEYADLLFVSPKSLSKRLKLHGYGTPTKLIRDRIVLEAKRALRYSQKSVKEIAFELGYNDPAYFTRLFKKAEGQSPQAYRSTYLGV